MQGLIITMESCIMILKAYTSSLCFPKDTWNTYEKNKIHDGFKGFAIKNKSSYINMAKKKSIVCIKIGIKKLCNEVKRTL